MDYVYGLNEDCDIYELCTGSIVRKLRDSMCDCLALFQGGAVHQPNQELPMLVQVWEQCKVLSPGWALEKIF